MPEPRHRRETPCGRPEHRRMPHREQALHITHALGTLRVPSAVVDRAGRLRWLNLGAAELVGDRVGEPLSALIAPEDRRLACDHFARKLAGEGDSGTDALTFVGRGGERVRARVSSAPFWEGDRIAGVFGIAWPVRLSERSPQAAPSLTGRQRETLGLLT